MRHKHSWITGYAVAVFAGSTLVAFAAPATATKPAATPAKPIITFPSADTARAALIDETPDPFLSRLQPPAMSALSGEEITGDTLEEQRAECRRRFQAGALEFSSGEKAAIRQLIEDLHPVMLKTYPQFAHTPWSLIKLSSNLCGGMSFTKGPHVVLSESMCGGIVMAAARKTSPARLGAIEILVHEQMHVFQKAHPGLLDPLHTRVLGFEFCAHLRADPYLIENELPNPDGWDCRWILPFRTPDATIYILPLLMLSEGQGLRRLPMSVRMAAVELEKTADGFRPRLDNTGKPVIRGLEDVPEFVRRFGHYANAYHPNEASADLFAKIFVSDMFRPNSRSGPRNGNRIEDPAWPGLEEASREQVLAEARRWFKRHLADSPSSSPTTGPSVRPAAKPTAKGPAKVSPQPAGTAR